MKNIRQKLYRKDIPSILTVGTFLMSLLACKMSKNLPKRISRSRAKGWTKPDNTIYVGRGSKWGNPFRVIGDMLYIDAGYRRKILDKWVLYEVGDITDEIHGFLRILTAEKSDHPDIQYWISHFEKLDLSQLHNKNLMCWCKQDTVCHADILLAFAQLSKSINKTK